jgi:hypothetical protein
MHLMRNPVWKTRACVLTRICPIIDRMRVSTHMINTLVQNANACVQTRVTRRIPDGVLADAVAGVDLSRHAYQHALQPPVIAVHARSECVRENTPLLPLEPNPFAPTLLYFLSP